MNYKKFELYENKLSSVLLNHGTQNKFHQKITKGNFANCARPRSATSLNKSFQMSCKDFWRICVWDL